MAVAGRLPDNFRTLHAFISFLAFLLATLAFAKARKHSGYQHDISNFLDDLDRIRLASIIQKPVKPRTKPIVSHKLEVAPKPLQPLVQAFNIHA